MHRKKYAFLLLALLAFSAAQAKEYGHYNPKNILTVTQTATGKHYGLNVAYLDRMLGGLARHAKNYPPRFESQQDRQRAVHDVRTLSGMLGIATDGASPSPRLLLRAAYLNSMGYNLDIPGAGQKADAQFRKLLAAAPDDPRGNYFYGVFLAGEGKAKQAIPHLKKALALGLTDAAFSLGMTDLSLGENKKALKNFEAYEKHYPTDSNVVRIINAIRNGRVKTGKAP